jgi:hypothetical protein
MLLRIDDLCVIAECGKVGELDANVEGPLCGGLCHRLFDTFLSEAVLSSAIICSRLGELVIAVVSGSRSNGLVTKTELLAESSLEVDKRDTQTPCRASLTLAPCGAITGSGGTGPVGGRFDNLCAPILKERACVMGLEVR